MNNQLASRFITGDGEMSSLTRNFDWSKTALGEIRSWPQSLLTTLNIMLNSRFPMFLFWGPELICFYNDAYRPSLGNNGKHPHILGGRGEDYWQEIWPVIKPLIDQVLAGGKSTWSEDQLIPIYRNGDMEDVYWTFSYSAVNDESGSPYGVFVTCNETTEKVITRKKLEENEEQLRIALEGGELGTFDFYPEKNKLEWSAKTKELFGLPSEAETDYTTYLQALHPGDRQSSKAIADQQMYLQNGGFYELEYRTIGKTDGKQRWLRSKGKATYNSDGAPVRYTGVIQDISKRKKGEEELVTAFRRVEESEKRFRNTVEQAPLGITIFRGPQFIVEMANDAYMKLIDRPKSDFIGKPLFESLPEVQQTVEPLLTSVLTTGEPFYAAEFPISLYRYGQRDELSYFNLIYHPLKEDDGKISGVMVVATEVTNTVKAKQALAESEKQFRNLVMQSPVAMCIVKGKEHIIEMANKVMLEKLWRKEQKEVIGKKIVDVFPELREQKYPELLQKVYDSGITHNEKESVAYVAGDDGIKKFYLDYEYHPLVETDGKTFAIMITVNDVTEKVEARRKVEENEERLRMATQITKIGTWEYYPLTNELNWSDECKEIYAFPKEAATDFTVFAEHIHPEDRKVVEEAIQHSMDIAGNGKYDISYRILRFNDNAERWIKANGNVYFNAEKKAERFIGTVVDITDQKLSQQILQESEQRSRLAIEAAEMGTFDWDLVTNHFISSQRLNHIFGFTSQPGITHNNLIDAFHPDDKPFRDEAVRSAAAKGSLSYEARIIWPDKSIHWVKVYGKITYKNQRPLKMYGTVMDVTETKNTLNILQESELHFKTISNVSPVGLWMTDTNGLNTFVNDTWIEWTGDPLEKQLGTGWLNRVVDEDKKTAPAKFSESMQKREKYITEFRILRSDGVLQWCLTEGSPYYDIHGNFAGYAGSVTDITERKFVQEQLEKKVEERTAALKKSEERNFRMINEVQDYAILLLSREGIIENWNKGAEKIKGYTEEEAVGKHFRIFYTKEDQAKKHPEHFIEKANKAGKATDEGWRVKKDGSAFWASTVITALHDSENNVIGFSKVTRDLTERKKAEEKLGETNVELKITNAALAKSNNELEQFAYVASHDLQEPLRKIRFFTERLENSMLNVSGLSKDYYNKIQKASERMDTLIKDLLDFSRLSKSNKLFVQTDLNTVLINIQNDFELLIHEKNAVIEIAPLPTIEAIPLQMQQLFYNLFSNALKFSKKDVAPFIKVSCALLKKDEMIFHNLDENLQYHLIEVKDNGIGFDQKYEKQIFVIFQRLNDIYSYSGTGIGLALCKKIVLNHHGKIYASGKENEGATFSIILPQ
jgi:PAS domain S-box-containing protein